jgi:predicted nucleic acid-binding protein
VIVLDASAVIEVLLDTDLGRRIEQQVWGDLRRTPNAPHLLDVEVMQVVGRLVRSKHLEADAAAAIVDDLRNLDLVRHSHVDLLDRVLEPRSNLTAYDGVYLALAQALNATVLTCDGKLAKAPGSRAKVTVVR